MKVLVVDDDVVARMMLMHLIDSSGSHAILEAEDGEDAWRQLEDGATPDIIFCDLRMPRLSGLELLGRVRARAAFNTLPFVLVSAASDAATLDEAAVLGASGYIIKPFQQEDVLAQFARMRAVTDDAGLEAPADVAARLGIDVARLRLYLDGLARQLQVASEELPGADAADAQARLVRLREGCATLGLHGAADALAGTDAQVAGQLALALALAIADVARQSKRVAGA